MWCEALPATTPYSQGLCRIYRGEVLALRGAWDEAEAEMRRAHQQLLPHKRQGAAEASYGVGEVLRRRGDLAGAEQAFVRAQQLGWDPQPGMALLRLAQGRVDAAAAALRSALASPTVDRFGRARVLAAQVEVAIAAGTLDEAHHAARELAAIADGLESAVVRATASMAQGALHLAAGSPARPRWRTCGGRCTAGGRSSCRTRRRRRGCWSARPSARWATRRAAGSRSTPPGPGSSGSAPPPTRAGRRPCSSGGARRRGC